MSSHSPSPLRVALCHNELDLGARADEQDVLVQVAAVRAALETLGHAVVVVPVGLDLGAWSRALAAIRPDLVFNLVESIGHSDLLASLAVGLLEHLKLPFTGSSSLALSQTNHKLLAKERMRAAGLPTPDWHAPGRSASTADAEAALMAIKPSDRFIVKPVGEHASLGMDDDALMEPRNLAELTARIHAQSEKLGRPCFAERYVAGREFNISLLATAAACEPLPLAEIDFSQFPAGKPRIVDYRAKWDAESFEFQNTPRRFLPEGAEPELRATLHSLAIRCWKLFQLGGYARVDFRVAEDGSPWILEINTNPCLSPDAGFQAALEAGGISFAVAVERILADALNQSSPAPHAIDPQPADHRRTAERRDDTELQWRFDVRTEDCCAVRELVAATGFFNQEEVAIAEELVADRLAQGPASGYEFVIAEAGGRLAGYASYGRISGTRSSFDLYWIAVDPELQGRGLGRKILERAEEKIAELGGGRVYIETSSRPQYESTRGFYLRAGYCVAAILPEFYGPADDKVIYVKEVAEPGK